MYIFHNKDFARAGRPIESVSCEKYQVTFKSKFVMVQVKAREMFIKFELNIQPKLIYRLSDPGPDVWRERNSYVLGKYQKYFIIKNSRKLQDIYRILK